MSVCCAVNLVNYISALQRAGEADVKRDLDYSRFSEITRRQRVQDTAAPARLFLGRTRGKSLVTSAKRLRRLGGRKRKTKERRSKR